MTGRFLRVPTMRPHRCWAVLHVSILAGLLLTLNAGREASDCEFDIKLSRHTIHEAFLGEDLKIYCTATFCNNLQPTISWYKDGKTDVLVSNSSHIKMEWELLNASEGKSMLIFQKIRRSDSGLYHCKSEDAVSHTINVTVHVGDGERTTVIPKNYTTLVPEPTVDLWLYMYTAAGIVAFVIIVIIISIVSMRGCKGKLKKEMRTEKQYVAIPMAEQPLPQPSPRGSPSAPPSRRSARRKTPPSQPDELPLPGDNKDVYGKVKNRERRENAAENEWGSVVYAALNHQPPAGVATRPQRPKETSEYAAIRVKDPSPTRQNYY